MKRTYLPSILLILLTINIVSSKENNSPIKLDYQTEGKISVSINNEPFTTYHYGKDRAKPILYPILSRRAFTRRQPVITDSPSCSKDPDNSRLLRKGKLKPFISVKDDIGKTGHLLQHVPGQSLVVHHKSKHLFLGHDLFEHFRIR